MAARNALLVLGALVAAVVLFLVLRPGDEEGEPLPAAGTAAETTAAEATTEETAAEPDTTTAEPAEPSAQRVVVEVRDGQVEGGVVRATVAQGERVVLVVRADVADHVHLHGYDLLVDVVPGRASRIRFRASETGRFEAELEDRGLLIAEIEVGP